MKEQKKKYLLYLLLVLTIGVAIFFLFKTQSLHKKIKNLEQLEAQSEANDENYDKLVSIDTLIFEGKYKEALDAYVDIEEKMRGNNSLDIKARVQFAKELIRMETIVQSNDFAKDTTTTDTLTNTKSEITEDINAYDSLSFVLEKAKVQISSMRNQLLKKSFGEYLTFKSTKGNKMHYVGQVKNKRANGYGVAILDTGSRYEGQWRENMRHGEGKFYWTDGESYEGSYVQDKRNGQGTYHWPNGEKYIGEWKDDKRSGHGEFYNEKGTIVTRGIWKDDKLVKEEK